MPKTDGRWTSNRAKHTKRIKRYVLLTTTIVALLAGLDQWGFLTNSYAKLSGGQGENSKAQRSRQTRVSRVRRPSPDRTSDLQRPGPERTATTQESGPAEIPALPESANGDCTFLRDPEKFRDALATHRVAVSALTETISNRLTSRQTNAAQPEDGTGRGTSRDNQTGRGGGSTSGRKVLPDIARKTFIDNVLFARMEKDGVAWASLSTDTEFIRRVTLDLTGRIPAPEDITKFVEDTNPAKRDLLIDSLIGTPEFVDKWTMFFGDLFKNVANATNINHYIGGRDAFYNYIKDFVANNKSYAQVAIEMIGGDGDSFVNGQVNFTVAGNVVMGPTQDTMDGLAVNASSTFLGLGSMDCLLCHNGAGHLDTVNLWGSQRTRAEAWGMSAFFARTRRQAQNVGPNYVKYLISENAAGEYQLNTNSGNRQARTPQANNGQINVVPKYIFGGGGVNAGENRRQAIARLITSDPQLARAAVNYIWEKLMVEALVSPSNSFDPARLDPNAQLPAGWGLQPANAELLEALSQEFIRSGYNIRDLIGWITKSSIYQLSSRYAGTWKLEYVPYYARKYVRRLDAEEVHDAIVKATGIPISYQMRDDVNANTYVVSWAMQLPEPVEPRVNGGMRAFLDSFLRGNRDSRLRTDEPSILQSLNLMNNAFVMGRIHRNNTGSTVAKLVAQTNLTPEQIIESLYLSTLSRKPTQDELGVLTPYFTSQGKPAATENLQWVLLNKVDFMFNY